MFLIFFFFFKQKTAYEMVMSDWSSDVCSSDLGPGATPPRRELLRPARAGVGRAIPVPRGARSEERRVGKECHHRVDLGGRRIIKKKKTAGGSGEVDVAGGPQAIANVERH